MECIEIQDEDGSSRHWTLEKYETVEEVLEEAEPAIITTITPSSQRRAISMLKDEGCLLLRGIHDASSHDASRHDSSRHDAYLLLYLLFLLY